MTLDKCPALSHCSPPLVSQSLERGDIDHYFSSKYFINISLIFAKWLHKSQKNTVKADKEIEDIQELQQKGR